MAAPPDIVWRPQAGPQKALVDCPLFEVFYGGARGGGKTDAMLGEWALHAARHGADAKGVFFRRELPQLDAAVERSKAIYGPLGAEWNEQKRTWRFPGGAFLRMRPLDRDGDAEKYQGHDYTRVYFEELTNYPSPGPVDRIKATLRSGAGVPCGFRATGNPGGPGHAWVRARYIDPGPWRVVVDQGLKRVFIPARLSDNRILTEADPLYVARLRQTGSAALVKAWLDGDWDAVEGAFFDCWSNARHVLRPFAVPPSWLRFRSMDWGSASPGSVGWWAVVTDDHRTQQGAVLPRGALVRYREWYIAKGPGIGLKLPNEEQAREIRRREAGETIAYGVADPAMFREDGGPSIAETFARHAVFFRAADNTRVAGWQQIRSRLIGLPDGRPMIYVFETCRDSIRTIPSLPHDDIRPEDVDTHAEDHAADDWRYACNARPWTPPATPPPRAPRDRWRSASDTTTGSWKVA